MYMQFLQSGVQKHNLLLLLLQLYNSLWVLACSIISFHCFLSCTLCFQFFTPIFLKYIFSFLFFDTRFGRLLSIRPAFNNWALLAVLGFSGTRLLALRPTPTWRTRVSLSVWLLPFDLSGLGDPTSSYATAGIALRVTKARKLPHHVKVETPSVECIITYFLKSRRKPHAAPNFYLLTFRHRAFSI